MRIRSAIVAARAILSREDNSLSLIEIAEDLVFAGVPDSVSPDDMIAARMYFVVAHDSPTEEEQNCGDIQARFWMETPMGPKSERPVRMSFEGAPRSRVFIEVQGIPYAGPGTYTFKMETPGGVASWDVEIAFPGPNPDPELFDLIPEARPQP